MKVTVEDVCNFPEFTNLKLVAGAGGINNAVERCGILDYEFVDGVREKWYNTNFRDENMLVITSFLYAKDNEFLIMDAVKKLAARKCSGLVIKNIFRLPLHENVLRYADTMNFPIMIIEGSDIHYEDLIILISERIKHYESLYYRESKVDEILRNNVDPETCDKLAYDINPTFKSDIMTMYFRPLGQFSTDDYLKMERRIMEGDLNFLAADSMFYYKGGFFLVHTMEMFPTADAKKLAAPVLKLFEDQLENFRIGVSSVHHMLWQIKNCFEESLYASSLEVKGQGACMYYEEMGIYKVILPYCNMDAMKDFCRRYIKPLEDYDLETNGSLLDTAIAYVMHDGDLQATADHMDQHKNTIRYRLKNVSSIIGINVLETKYYEILSFAVRIYICNNGSL